MTHAQPATIIVLAIAALVLAGCATPSLSSATTHALPLTAAAPPAAVTVRGESSLFAVSVGDPVEPGVCTGHNGYENGAFNVSTPSGGHFVATWTPEHPTTAN